MDGEVKPEVIARSMVKFSKPGYRVEALKVQVPVNMAFVAGSPGWKRNSLHSRIGDGLLSAAEDARVPFIYMSQGVHNEAFQYALELAAEAGVNFSGVLCGRATGKDGVAVFVEHGLRALADWLHSEGVRKHSEREATGPTVILDEETHSEKR
jgi:tagatose 1,6-diphosphate aldolase